MAEFAVLTGKRRRDEKAAFNQTHQAAHQGLRSFRGTSDIGVTGLTISLPSFPNHTG
jgi:hypothetical protein